MVVQVHTEFRHDCSDFPLGLKRPGTFTPGEHEVPDDVGDYFIRAGWASPPGGQVAKPDPSKPVLLLPANARLGTKDSN